MDLYIYDHCPFCNKARVGAGLLGSDIKTIILASDDEKTPKDLIGKKMLPILIKADSTPMGESMDIVAYLNSLPNNKTQLNAQADEFIDNWVSDFMPNLMRLTIPRSTKIDFEEFKTQSAKDYFTNAKKPKFGDFEILLANSQEYIEKAEKDLQNLENYFVEKNYLDKVKQKEFGYSDVNLYSFLRLASSVKGLNYPTKVQDYMQIMQEASGLKLLTQMAV